jgi:CDP-diacylglycerol--serine O-phosphatidyltransferase
MYLKIQKQIPNLFTLGNLTCGVLAILAIFNGERETAVYLVILAAILDFFDGFLARLLKVSGELGKQLDSLADLVTFGVAPSFMLYASAEMINGYARYSFILLAVFSAYRLAKFNIDTRQSTSFIGVPTPITGLACISWGMINGDVKDFIFDQPWVFVLYCIVVSLLLVSEINMPSLKFKKGKSSQYTQHLILLVIGIVSLLFFGWLCIPIFYAAYVLSSILINFAPKERK